MDILIIYQFQLYRFLVSFFSIQIQDYGRQNRPRSCQEFFFAGCGLAEVICKGQHMSKGKPLYRWSMQLLPATVPMQDSKKRVLSKQPIIEVEHASFTPLPKEAPVLVDAGPAVGIFPSPSREKERWQRIPSHGWALWFIVLIMCIRAARSSMGHRCGASDLNSTSKDWGRGKHTSPAPRT